MLDRLVEITEAIRTHPKLVIADDFEIAAQAGYESALSYRNGEELLSVTGEELWIRLRILHRKRPGRAVVSVYDRPSVNELVARAFESAERSGVDPWYRFPMWKPVPAPKTKEGTRTHYRSVFPGLPEGAEQFDERYGVQEVSTILRRKTEKNQLTAFREAHRAEFSLRGTFPHGRAQFSGEAWSDGPLYDRKAPLAEIWRRFSPAAKANFDLDVKRAALVVAPAVARALLRKIAPWFCADSVLLGRSPLSGTLGEPVFAPAITLGDFGLVPGGILTEPFDLEGSLPQNTVLVEKGVVKNFLFDMYYGLKENRLSTGNYRRAPGDPEPRIAPSNFCIEAGATPFAKLIEDLENGLWIESVDRIQPVPAESSRYFALASGWRVVSGRCVEPFLNKPIEFDPQQWLQNVEAVGSDLGWGGPYGSPSLLIREISLEA